MDLQPQLKYISLSMVGFVKYILDTSAILSGKSFSADLELYSSPMIVEEIQHGRMRRHLDYLLEAGLTIMAPSQEVLDLVRKTARESGDIGRVSEADIEILSLARELDAVLLSDDYSIQNLASILGIRFQGVAQEGITEVFEWEYRCRGCGRYFKEMHKACPVCGSELRTKRKM